MSPNNSLLIQDLSPYQFFQEMVTEAQSNQQNPLSHRVEYYLINLLCDFISMEADSWSHCLALTFQEAQESEGVQQKHLFRKLGDTALYFSGFFQESFARKAFDVSYYIQMGEMAYQNLGVMTSDSQDVNVFTELSASFVSAVDILIEVSENTSGAKHLSDNILATYEGWLLTASQKLEQELRKKKIIPIKSSKKNII